MEKKEDSNSDCSDDEEELIKPSVEMDEETKRLVRIQEERIFEIKKVSAKKRADFDQKLKDTTPQNFKDRPDEISG